MADGRHLGDRHFTDNTYPGYAAPGDYVGPDGVLNKSDVHAGETFESYVARRPTPAHRAEKATERLQGGSGAPNNAEGSTYGGGHISERQTGVQGVMGESVSDG